MLRGMPSQLLIDPETGTNNSKKRIMNDSMLSPQLKDVNYSGFPAADTSDTSVENVTPKHNNVTSSQSSQTLRRSRGLLNLSIETSPKPEFTSSPKFSLMRKKLSAQDLDDANLNFENLSPFKEHEPSTPTISKSQSLKRPASNGSSFSPYTELSINKNGSFESNKDAIQLKINKLRKMVSADKFATDSDSPFNMEHPLPNPSIHFQPSHNDHVESPSNSPSRPARQKLKIDKSVMNKNPLNLRLHSENTEDLITPSSYKFVKPLQTAFMSSGLLSKKNTSMNESFHPPETPCKKQPIPSLRSTQKQSFPSSNLQNVITASSPMINDNSTPKAADEPLNENTPYDQSPSMQNLTNSLPKSAKAINTHELRNCLMNFASDFDDSTESIFDDTDNSNHPSTPTRLRNAKNASILNKPKSHSVSIDADDSILSHQSSYNSSIDDHLTSKFENVQVIGKGEFSNVYEITFQTVKYAVKRIKTPLLGPKRRKRIFEEVEVLKILQENISNDDEGKEYVINFINDWENNNQLYIMMEFCENGPLDKFLLAEGKSSRIDEWRVWKILVEVGMGLRYIHTCNILHLDLKPANIFITFDGSLKIGDFGMAAKYPVPNGFEREGDREYIAPEIIAKQQYDKPADVFSFGLIMVEIAANIILPENGIEWHKLRSGDLTEAGRLSSGELNLNLYNDSTASKNSTFSSLMNNTGITGSSYSSVYDPNSRKLPPWTPKFLVDGKGALDKLVQWMISPEPQDRPSATQILNTLEAQFVEVRRKSGAVIQEGDYGPPPDADEESLMSNDVKGLNMGSLNMSSVPAAGLTIPSDIMDEDEW